MESLTIDHAQLEKIVREAGALALSYFGKTKDEFKDDGVSYAHSIVTVADKAVEDLLLKKLVPLFSNHQFFGEESGVSGEASDFVWYIDPIDGTSNFARNNPMWAISLGLAYKNVPVFGIIYFPRLDEYFWAQEGEGAWLNNEKIQVSERPIDQALYMVGSLYYKGERRYSKLLAERCAMMKSMMCAVLGLTQVARGAAECYTPNTYQVYDVCAGIIIAKEAGAEVTTKDGTPWHTKSGELIIATPTVYDEVKNLLEEEGLYEKTVATLKK